MKGQALKRILLAFVVLALAAFVLAGCGGGSSSKSSSGTTSTESSEPSEKSSSSDHTSEWTEEKETAFYAKLEKEIAASVPQIAGNPVVKEIGECNLEQFKPLYSPEEVLAEGAKPPQKAQEIGQQCLAKFKPQIEEAAKKAQEGGSTGSTEGSTGSTESESTGETGST